MSCLPDTSEKTQWKHTRLLWDLCLSWRILQNPDLFDGLFYGAAAASRRRIFTGFTSCIYMCASSSKTATCGNKPHRHSEGYGREAAKIKKITGKLCLLTVCSCRMKELKKTNLRQFLLKLGSVFISVQIQVAFIDSHLFTKRAGITRGFYLNIYIWVHMEAWIMALEEQQHVQRHFNGPQQVRGFMCRIMWFVL